MNERVRNRFFNFSKTLRDWGYKVMDGFLAVEGELDALTSDKVAKAGDDMTGNLGIHKATPAALLHVGGDTGYDGEVRIESDAGRTIVLKADDTGNYCHAGTMTNHAFRIVTNDTEAILVNTDQTVEIAGNVSISDYNARVELIDTHPTNSTSGFNETWLLHYADSYQVQHRNGSGTYLNYSYRCTWDTTTGGADNHIWRIGSTTPMKLTSGGDLLLGTGTDNGLGKLQVEGDITCDDIICNAGTTQRRDWIQNTSSTNGPVMHLYGADDASYPGRIAAVSCTKSNTSGNTAFIVTNYNGSTYDTLFHINDKKVATLADGGIYTFSSGSTTYSVGQTACVFQGNDSNTTLANMSAALRNGISRRYDANGPTGWGHTVTVGHYDTRGFQLHCEDAGSDVFWLRNQNSNGTAWEGWRRIATCDDVTGDIERFGESWNNLTLQNSWANYGGTWATAQYRKMPDGRVEVKGFIRYGVITTGTIIATLPTGYRPTEIRMKPVFHVNGACAVDVGTDGTIKTRNVTNNGWLSIEFSFYP